MQYGWFSYSEVNFIMNIACVRVCGGGGGGGLGVEKSTSLT